MTDTVETPEVIETPDEVVPQLSEVEIEAQEAGWKTKEEWVAGGKAESEWTPAKQWKKEFDLFQKIETLNKDLKSTRSTLTALKGHYEKVKETEFKAALETLKAQKKRALDEGDSDAVIDIDDKIDQVKETQRQVNAINPQPEVHPDFSAWVQRNQWYSTDTELQEFADTVGRSYAKANPGIDPKDVLKHVAEKVKRTYPEKFKNERRTSAPAVEASRPQGKKTEDYELSDLERQVMEKLVRGGHTTKEKYIAELKKAKGIK